MATTLTLKAVGLNTNPNQLDLPEGSLIEANNVIINRENVIEPIRGTALFGEAFGTSNDRAKQLFQYKDRILRHYSNKLQFQNGTLNNGDARFDTFSGDYLEAQENLRIKKIDSAGNLYFTTSDGIKKISAKTAFGLSTNSDFIRSAGGIKAVDFYPELVVTPNGQTGFLPQDAAVAYRVLWGTKDANDNLILGAPSQREQIFNPLSELLVADMLRTLQALDNVSYAGGSLISDGDYVDTLKVPVNATSPEIQAALVLLASKIDQDLLFASTLGTDPLDIASASITTGVCTITFGSGNPSDYFSVGNRIFLNNFVVTGTGSINGSQAIAAVTTTTLSFNTSATGTITIGSTETIESGTYRDISEPAVPEIPTPNQQLVNLQTYLNTVITDLQLEATTATPPRISSASRTAYIDPLDITTTATVKLTITIPEDVDSSYFLQVYRSAIAQATGTTSIDDISPNDEMQLVYEAYPTSSELTASEMIVFDITPDDFRGANLYTNAATGEGILQANDIPPYALDINRFKNVVFYANTRTKHRLSLNLISVQNMIDAYNLGGQPGINLVESSVNLFYKFVVGVKENIRIIATSGATLNSSGTASYFVVNSAEDEASYYFWYKVGTAVDPALSNKTGVMIIASALDSAVTIATKTIGAVSSNPRYFNSALVSGSTLEIENVKAGYTTAPTNSSPFTITVQTSGIGEDAALRQVLLSDEVSVAVAVDQTARSLVRVINKDSSSPVYAYYLSGPTDVPGKIFFESKTLDDSAYYLVGNNSTTGASFTPDISPSFTITAISTGLSPIVTTSSAHGLSNNDTVIIPDSNSTPALEGIFSVKVLTTTTFQVQTTSPITVSGTSGYGVTDFDAIVSQNERKINRVYYSKLSQPEAVPLLNFLDVGDSDKEILRIFPLRDSLFVFKEDGLYRISGETAPFTLSLFDSSYILTAPDSIDVANNMIFGYTTQGISTVSEGGINVVSNPIYEKMVQLTVLPGYKYKTFGVGYESDNSYTMYTVSGVSDLNATIGYRYSTKTNSWTNVNKDTTCGFINFTDDKMYLGAGDVNYIEQERKSFSRTDYANRQFDITLAEGSFLGNRLRFSSVTNIEEGDVLLQTQYLTPYEFNMLLKKLDVDPGIASNDFFVTLEADGGDNMRAKIEALANKLDLDTGVVGTDYFSSIENKSGTISLIDSGNPTQITSSSHELLENRYISISGSNSLDSVNGNWIISVVNSNIFSIDTNTSVAGSSGSWTTLDSNFLDIVACYNIIINKLNNDSGVSFSNYDVSNTSTQIEAVVTSVDKNQKYVTLNLDLDFISGPITAYKSIQSSFVYAPIQMGDPVNYKHLREATLMFMNKAFTSGTLSFATDLLPEFQMIPFLGDGNGIFGHSNFGNGFFGGSSHSAPFRTYVPRQCQRCRFVVVKFEHMIARENYGIYGLTITGENTNSTRAYRG